MAKSEVINRWLALGANVGVLVGLALLIVELGQNSDLLRAQIHQARSDNYEAFMVANADTEFFLPAWERFRAAGGPEDIAALDVLSPTQKARISRYLQARIGGMTIYFSNIGTVISTRSSTRQGSLRQSGALRRYTRN